ncbi:uncharacterized protein Dana_GF24984 [Drosophila ananassae]|uniref:RNA polymerase II-associated protein 1 n=1 Tax=Drosophila ananassae TaxID=7217 RepID=B3M7T1_DROAN|nr:RNA polymerase II-associated protein 1 [Drosophila ananassae]EDV38804.1 uncharacterized protein Dana_GF24984 [Drosophila ananassae]
MFKKLKPGESEEDVLRMAAEFNAERAKNPGFQPAAAFVRMDKAPKKSMFAQRREQAKLGRVTSVEKSQPELLQQEAEEIKTPLTSVSGGLDSRKSCVLTNKVLMDEIQENILGDVKGTRMNPSSLNNVLGDLVERPVASIRPVMPDAPQQRNPNKPMSIFARQMMCESSPKPKASLRTPVASENVGSSIVKDAKMAQEIHEENLNILSQMSEQDILAEREKLLASLDPSLIALLAQKRQAKQKPADNKPSLRVIEAAPQPPKTTQPPNQSISSLPDTNPTLELLQQGDEGQWLHFNLVEEHKLAWMRDIPTKINELKPGQQFDARFDWKGVLLPHTLQEDQSSSKALDDRELYLHGAEADRPGYTLQEFFRLARSTVLQQRISAFGAVAGIFSIYNQGFYDQVLTLPISKMFFLLRYGLDDNAPAQLEVVSRALANLLYNETDEVVLDNVQDNAYCHWQPLLKVLENASDAEADSDPNSIAFLQNYMKLLTTSQVVRADVDEGEVESRMSMDDFQLAETDLIDCLLRTNILQRIKFILNSVRPDNSTVESCLKVLIRIARTSLKVARQLANESDLLEILFRNFMPSGDGNGQFYGQPQVLFLKLIRVLTCQHLDIAKSLSKGVLIQRLQLYLFLQDTKARMVRVQIEALRILRCLLLLGIVDRDVFRQFLPALRQLLDWHSNHCVFDGVGGSGLVRQHAAALIVALVASGESGVCDLEGQKLVVEQLNNCCCKWLNAATHSKKIKDFSQMTLLSAALYAASWFSRNGYLGTTSFQIFLRSILPKFVQSPSFVACVQDLALGSVILRRPMDRRHVNAALPNMGAVLMHDYGPQLIVSESYPVHLLSNLWALLAVSLEGGGVTENSLFTALMQPAVLEPLAEYLRELGLRLNRVLATNFFARTELRFVHQLLTTDGLETYLERPQLLQLVYSYLCCLSTAHATQIKSTFQRFIFNGEYVELDAKSLKLLEQTCLEMVYPHIIADNSEPSLSLCYTQAPILPADWPFFQMRLILSNYLQNVQQRPAAIYSENQVVRMTLTFVRQLERQGLQIVSPLEKLMYLMIAFMGPDSQFLTPDLHELLRDYLKDFNQQYANHHFDFDAELVDKARFEPLYYLFVEHFEAASYGDELFSSLVLLPLAQKYDNKWRRRLWSEHVQAVRFLNCDESLLMGGLSAYLNPVEEEPSLVQLYGDALERQLVRPGSVAFRIAQHHFNHSTAVHKTKSF